MRLPSGCRCGTTVRRRVPIGLWRRRGPSADQAVVGTLSRKPYTACSWPLEWRAATSKPTMGAGVVGGAEFPGESDLFMVAVDRPCQTEAEVGELGLHCGDGLGDGLCPFGDGHGVDVAGIGGEQRFHSGASGSGVSFVPGVDVALREVVERGHGCS